MYKFDAKDATEKCIKWIQDFFKENGPTCNAVLGISGGKDSSIVAALCVKALGKDRVIGVLMPKGEQFDINYSEELCDFLDIKRFTVNIKEAEDAIYNAIGNAFEITNQTKFNLPPRIRMSVVYAVAQSNNGRVANTCNLSEDWVGYSTRYGDSVGDFSPLSCFTVTEVKQIGRVLGLPMELVFVVATIVCAIATAIIGLYNGICVRNIHKFTKTLHTSASLGFIKVENLKKVSGCLIAVAVYYGLSAISTLTFMSLMINGTLAATAIIGALLLKKYFSESK